MSSIYMYIDFLASLMFLKDTTFCFRYAHTKKIVLLTYSNIIPTHTNTYFVYIHTINMNFVK